MPTLFGVDIAGIMGREMGPKVLPLTVIAYTAGTRTAGQLTGGTGPTPSNHTGRGFMDEYRDSQVDGTNIKVGDRKVCILGASIDIVPAVGYDVTIEGTQFRIVNVQRDPAGALYTCQVRR